MREYMTPVPRLLTSGTASLHVHYRCAKDCPAKPMKSQVARRLLNMWHEFQIYGMRYRVVACVNRRLTDSCAQIPHI